MQKIASLVALAFIVQTNTQRPDLAHYFTGLDATFVLLNGKTNQYIRYNTARADQRFAPCSSFKIPHTALLLESGIAPDADLLAVKACWHRRPGTSEAWCSSWTLAKAIDFAIVEHVRVLNLSLSGPPDPLLRRLIVKAISEQNITVVAAVMEHEDPALSFPANLSTVIAVIASDAQGRVRAHVGKQPTLLAAPGIEVLTTVPNGAYDFVSGSSFATAHVSGIVALLLEGNPQLSPREVRDLLVDSGHPVNGNDPETASVRHVDACAALRRVLRGSCS